MKRDLELVRKILFFLEEKEDFEEPLIPEFEGVSEYDVIYHIKLMYETGLVEAVDWSDSGGADWRVISMTASGHDFLEAARNETFWKRAKSVVIERGGALTVGAIKVALTQVFTNAVSGNVP